MKKSHVLAVLVQLRCLLSGSTACGGDDDAEAGEVTTVAITEAESATDAAAEDPRRARRHVRDGAPRGRAPGRHLGDGDRAQRRAVHHSAR